ncbi:two-component regulator propeller domain-containing protein [Roseivirga sp.]|uniref:hybrid sensor histidine kinase/response regulator n=1 Tax=Roseivirga sp. TaxID=1964215 RepID=UPI003B8AF13E
MPKFLLIAILSCFTISIKAQSGSELFYRMYADYGLSSDKTTVALQDHLGFMWFGSEEGLNRMIGYSDFEVFRNNREDSLSISNDHITALFEDSSNRLWIGTKDGLNLFDRSAHKFQVVAFANDPTDAGSRAVLDIIEDANGALWVLCHHQIVKLNSSSLSEELSIELPARNIFRNSLNRLHYNGNEILVAASSGLFKVEGEKLVQLEIAKNESVTSILSVNNELWIGTNGNGVWKYTPEKGLEAHYQKSSNSKPLINNYVNDISLVDESEIWIATNDGISVIELTSGQHRVYQYDFNNGFSLSDKVLRRIYQDSQGAVWITTPSSGISYYHEADNLFAYYGQSQEEGTDRDLMDYSVSSLLSAKDGSTWIGSRKGISQFNPKTNRFQHFAFPEKISESVMNVSSIAQCSAEYIWMGTDDGLIKWRGLGQPFEYIMPDKLRGLNIESVMADDDDNLLLGTSKKGVFLYASVSKVLREVAFEVEGSPLEYNPKVNVIRKLGDKIFVGTDEGLYLLNDLVLTKVSLSGFNDLPDNIIINDLFRDSQSRIWLGTKQDGALLLSDSLTVIADYSKKSIGIANNDVRSILEDERNDIWLSTNSGISKLVLNKDSVKKGDAFNYDSTDGLQGEQFIARSSAVTEDGRLLFGGLNGLTIFRPQDLEVFSTDQRPIFTGLTIKGENMEIGEPNSPLQKDIALTKRIELNPDQNDFVLKFDALDYVRPDDVVYRYKLEGYDADWIEKEDYGEASYQNIPVGKTFNFVFQSKGRLSIEWSNEQRIDVYVAPYFYQLLWFKVIIILLILGGVYFLFWLRERRSEAKQQELERIVEERSSTLKEEIQQRRKTEKRLTEALDTARDASEIKDKFLANMSHEIRTPLNGIMGLTELVLDSKLDEEQEDLLNTISSSAKSLKLIVNDILDIAKIESGNLLLVSEPFSVQDLLKEVLSSFTPEAKNKGIKLQQWVLNDVPAFVSGDVKLIRQVLVNLVSNAVKFTHEGGVTVFVECLKSANQDHLELWFTVEDSGIGIAQEDQERIFESFSQVDTNRNRQYGGTGLGLSISREFVKKMGGELWVESKIDKGSIFKFHVKIRSFDMVEANKKSTTEKIIDNPNLTGNILLVEDNLINQKVAVKMLEKRGLKVICAEDGSSAIALLESANFDLILMDLMMPLMDGYEATRQIRAGNSSKSNIPIIALTATATDGEKEKCLAVGMNGYLAKPVGFQELIETISPYLGKNQILKIS